MRLSELLDGVEILKSDVGMQENVDFIFSDSRKLKKNGIFVAIRGENRDGNDYIEQVLGYGAKCAITDDERIYEKYKKCILVENSRKALAHIWNNYYGKPASNMKIVAITGTNGKTSCAHFLYNIFKSAGLKRGLISTINCLINDIEYSTNGGSDVSDLHSAMTTPDPEVLYAIFNEMRNNDVKYVVMEASSHSLELSKLAPLTFEASIFTNLSPEHLDFHKNMESYFKAKKVLFSQSNVGIVNVDDGYGKRLLVGEKCNMISASLRDGADAIARIVELSKNGSKYTLVLNDKEKLNIECKICGEFSVYNSMLVAVSAFVLGIEKGAIIEGILSTNAISGRLEKVDNQDIYIDYAHTPYAMNRILQVIRQVNSQKKICVVFGCGGDRDKSKRAEMGKIATEMADYVIVTSDNPRTEEPIRIIIDILNGISDHKKVMVLPNRKEAIEYAIKNRGECLILLLGKGHEQYEIDKSGKHYFSERALIKEILNNDKNKADIYI